MTADAPQLITLDDVWATLPADTWVALHRTTGAHQGLDRRYSYWAEIGFKGDRRTGQLFGETAVEALTKAVAAWERLS